MPGGRMPGGRMPGGRGPGGPTSGGRARLPGHQDCQSRSRGLAAVHLLALPARAARPADTAHPACQVFQARLAHRRAADPPGGTLAAGRRVGHRPDRNLPTQAGSRASDRRSHDHRSRHARRRRGRLGAAGAASCAAGAASWAAGAATRSAGAAASSRAAAARAGPPISRPARTAGHQTASRRRQRWPSRVSSTATPERRKLVAQPIGGRPVSIRARPPRALRAARQRRRAGRPPPPGGSRARDRDHERIRAPGPRRPWTAIGRRFAGSAHARGRTGPPAPRRRSGHRPLRPRTGTGPHRGHPGGRGCPLAFSA